MEITGSHDQASSLKMLFNNISVRLEAFLLCSFHVMWPSDWKSTRDVIIALGNWNPHLSLLLCYWCFFFSSSSLESVLTKRNFLNKDLFEGGSVFVHPVRTISWARVKKKWKRACSSWWCLTFRRLEAAAWCTATAEQTDTSNGQKNGSTTVVNIPLSLVHKCAPVHQRHIFTVQPIPFFKHILVIHQHAFLF